MIHFGNEESQRRWWCSTVLAQWVVKLKAHGGDLGLKALPSGFGSCFASLASGSEGAFPPSGKMALAVLLGLYPTVMLITLFSGTYTQPQGLAVAMLRGNSLSVVTLNWAVSPVLNTLLAPWFQANSLKQIAF
jgi:antibiotic biosynthesis monooxygenase (ABM) superfamily enzyme